MLGLPCREFGLVTGQRILVNIEDAARAAFTTAIAGQRLNRWRGFLRGHVYKDSANAHHRSRQWYAARRMVKAIPVFAAQTDRIGLATG